MSLTTATDRALRLLAAGGHSGAREELARREEPLMQPVMVRMPGNLYAEVKRLAEQDDRSISWIIRRAVTLYVAAADGS